MTFNNCCKECQRKVLNPRDSLNVLMTGYCNDCFEHLGSDECIANSEGVADESGLWGEALFEKVML